MREIQWQSFGETNITPFTLGVTLLLGIIIFFLPKKYVPAALILPIMLISEFQRIVIGGIDLNMMRILILFGWFRVIFRNEFQPIKMNAIDITIILWVLAGMITYTLLRKEMSALTYRLGGAFGTLGLYFLLRLLLRDLKTIDIVFKGAVFIAVIIACSMIIENLTMSNPLSILGGSSIPFIREGRIRCQAAFGHPILAGTFGATLMPIFFAFWWQDKMRSYAIMGMAASVVITITSASSGPMLTFLFGIVGLGFFHLRGDIKIIKVAMVIGLVVLDMIMKAPIWFLIARVAVVGGSTAYHRAALIDAAVNHLKEWWLLGTKSTAHWGWGLQDTTNHFIREGTEGGLITMILFILIIVFSFQTIGRLIPYIENQSMRVKISIWSIGVFLFTHIVSFFGVSYFDQMIFFWIFLIAAIATYREFFEKMIFYIKLLPALKLKKFIRTIQAAES